MLRTYSPAELLSPKEPIRAFPYWARLVSSVNLSAKGGWALGDHWVRPYDTFVPQPGEYLVVMRTIGSRKNPVRDTALFAFDLDGARLIEDGDIRAAVQTGYETGRVSATQFTQSMNNELYRIALFVHLKKET